MNLHTVATELHQELEGTGAKLKYQISAAELTTIAAGGIVAVLVEPQDLPQLSEALGCLRSYKQLSFVLGAGSNLLIADAGIVQPVIRLGKGFKSWEQKGNEFVVGAGASLMNVSRTFSDAGWSGLEFAGGIPASIGGAIRMNAGAHGGEMAHVLSWIEVLSREGELVRLAQKELCMSYRHTQLPDGAVVVRAGFSLRESDASKTAALRADYLSERKRRQPLHMPSVGSVFRNPSSELSAGAVLESVGMKGQTHGGAQISAMHANWIVNPERKALASDVSALIQRCQEQALRQRGIRLTPEVVSWG
jgi:UDP-N-acetylmuramate dehydrogenase